MGLTAERARAVPPVRLFLCIFAVVFALIAIWSVAMPLNSGPDEPTHEVRAAGLVRGQFVGRCGDTPNDPTGSCPKSSAFTEMDVPAFYSLLRNGGNIAGTKIPHHGTQCYARRVDVPASCVIWARPAQYRGLSENAWIYDGRYPPLYYALVGLPSLIGSSRLELYLMRLASAAASAFFFSVAIFSVLRYSRRRLLLAGIAVGATPVAVYLAGVVNANGLEASSAVAFWTTATILVRERAQHPPRALIVLLCLSAAVFESSRALSPFWIAVATAAVILTARWRDVVALASRRDLLLGVSAVLILGVADIVWIVYEHATALNVSSKNAQALIPKAGTSELSILATSFHHNIYYVPGMVGVFGAFDTWAPRVTFVIFYALVVVLFVAALGSARLRPAIVLVAVAVGVVLLPVLISSSQARQIGYVWSGRDTLPFAVGLPILSAGLISRPALLRLVRVLAPIAMLAVAFATFAALERALWRYAVGEAVPGWSFVTHPSWSPPVLGVLGVLITSGVLYLGAYTALGISIARRGPERGLRRVVRAPVGEPGGHEMPE